MLGFELVNRDVNYFHPDKHQSALSPEDKIKSFFDQVTVACVNAEVFVKNDFLLSISIDYEIALHILDNIAIRNILQHHSYIRLTVNAFFSEFKTGPTRPVLRSLSEKCTLWLEHFGEGSTSLSVIMNEKFERIKISKQFFWQHQGTLSLRKIIEHLKPYCNGVIVCGVENTHHIEYLKGSDIQAMQGILWSPYSQEELIQAFF